MSYYGPSRPDIEPNIDAFSTPSYLTRHASKIRKDLNKMARLYNGHKVRLFQLVESQQRCSACTDALTGQVLDSSCAVCGGTGYASGYTKVPGDFYTFGHIPAVATSEEMQGNVESSASQTVFSLVYGPLLEQDDLIITVDTKDVYKSVRMNPDVVAIGGEVITQVITCSRLTKGRPEYSVIDW